MGGHVRVRELAARVLALLELAPHPPDDLLVELDGDFLVVLLVVERNLADVGTGFADGHKTTIRLGATRRQHLIARFRGNR